MAPVGVLFVFSFPKHNKAKFSRELYGYIDRSKNRKYTYYRKGLLSHIPYIKLKRSCIIIRAEDRKKIRDFFLRHKINFSERIVFLGENEATCLKISNPNKWQNILEDIKGSPNFIVSIDF